MGNYFNDDEFEGVESVKISAKRNKGKKMVNGVPMATVYEGMSLHRFYTLQAMEQEAWDKVFWEQYDRQNDTYTDTTGAKFQAAQDAEFRRLCQQAARKAGWHAKHRGTVRTSSTGTARNNHPTNNKKGK